MHVDIARSMPARLHDFPVSLHASGLRSPFPDGEFLPDG